MATQIQGGVEATSAHPYAVKLPVFEGPLDLLLHLIRIDEVEITDIPIAQVAEQYIEYLELMRELNLDIAGEYLVMAATLAWIKSRLLLPIERVGEDDEGIDPRAELIARLLEYQRFKEAADDLGERPLLGRDVFEARAQGVEPVGEGEREIAVGVFELVEAFRRALHGSRPSAAPHQVEAEPISLRDRMLEIMSALKRRESFRFEELLGEEGAAATRTMIVATFLAVLELTRLEALGLFQGLDELGSPVGPIHVRRRGELHGEAWLERVSELT